MNYIDQLTKLISAMNYIDQLTKLISAMNYIDQLTKELMVQEHVLRELQQEQERRRLLQLEHSQWSNKIHNLRLVGWLSLTLGSAPAISLHQVVIPVIVLTITLNKLHFVLFLLFCVCFLHIILVQFFNFTIF